MAAAAGEKAATGQGAGARLRGGSGDDDHGVSLAVAHGGSLMAGGGGEQANAATGSAQQMVDVPGMGRMPRSAVPDHYMEQIEEMERQKAMMAGQGQVPQQQAPAPRKSDHPYVRKSNMRRLAAKRTNNGYSCAYGKLTPIEESIADQLKSVGIDSCYTRPIEVFGGIIVFVIIYLIYCRWKKSAKKRSRS